MGIESIKRLNIRKMMYILLKLMSEILLQKFNTFKSCFQVTAFMHDHSTD